MKTWLVTLHEGRRGTHLPYTVEVDAADGHMAARRAVDRCRAYGVQGHLRIIRIAELPGGGWAACA